MAAVLKQAGKTAAVNLAQQILRPAAEKAPTFVFLGPPGVGKGTYAGRIAQQLDLSHISVGDLVRREIKAQSELGKTAAAAVARGDLLSDNIIFELLATRMNAKSSAQQQGFLLDGFPRTVAQAETLLDHTDVRIAVNLHLREDVLLEKCLGRRICERCGANYNVANINLPASGSLPPVVMPPLEPKPGCRNHLMTRADDTEQTFRHRMEIYNQEAAPVEEIFRASRLLLDFQIRGGIPETMPHLVAALKPFAFAAHQPQQIQHAA